ncbi:MAG: hypothetical protein AB7I33_15080 [Gemmatimonadales bacterium]
MPGCRDPAVPPTIGPSDRLSVLPSFRYPSLVCYYLHQASPLTLSEIRSMLPVGLAADLEPPASLRTARRIVPDAQTVVRIIHGACSCDLVVQRHPVSREDEAHLRRRYRRLGLSREQTIAALENHRRAVEGRPRPPDHWPVAFAGFVAEHARNAGPTLYLLRFDPEGRFELPQETAAAEIPAAAVRANPGRWLPEDRPVLVRP